MNKFTFNVGGIAFLAAVIFVIYYLLPHNKFVITAFFSSTNRLIRDWHVLTVGLLPIFIALMIFGTAIIGVYLGSALYRWIAQRTNQD